MNADRFCWRNMFSLSYTYFSGRVHGFQLSYLIWLISLLHLSQGPPSYGPRKYFDRPASLITNDYSKHERRSFIFLLWCIDLNLKNMTANTQSIYSGTSVLEHPASRTNRFSNKFFRVILPRFMNENLVLEWKFRGTPSPRRKNESKIE